MGLLIVSSIITSTWFLAEKQTALGEGLSVLSSQVTKLVNEVEAGKELTADLKVRVVALETSKHAMDTNVARFWNVDWPAIGKRLDRLEQFLLGGPVFRER